ncbi:MAG TPA: HD domain-containing phosphohydrolase [Burkholderiaceae bacterium]|jgi:HD-GYP domain-containing protein (c-di-GMP phosphodiesterase class II)
MNKISLRSGHIQIGQPLQWDIYNEQGELLLKKGNIVHTAHQLNALIERGLFAEANEIDIGKVHREKAAVHQRAVVPELPSIIRMLNGVAHQLGPLLYSLHHQSDAQNSIMDVAKEVVRTTNLNPNIALASIFLNHAIADHAIRHSLNVAIISILVGKVMKKSEDELSALVAAALTMNLSMLRKQNEYQERSDALTEYEREAIQQHPHESVRMLELAGVTNQDWLSSVLHHHEFEDGSGYPFGKTADAIPQNAKILTLSDMFCARVTGRSYRKPLLPNGALRNLFVDEQAKVDKKLAPYFIGAIGFYPSGTSVKLQNGEMAIVTYQGHSPQTPVVQSYLGPFGAPLAFPIKRDTLNSRFAIIQAISLEDAPLCFSMHQIWGNEAAS